MHAKYILPVIMAVMSVLNTSAAAQDFPSQPVKLIVPYGAGTVTDSLARALSQRLQEIWKQPVPVENIAGAGGVPGTQRLQQAKPDGYTIALIASGHAMLPAIQPSLPFDPLANFTPVMSLAVTPHVFVATPGHYKSLKDLLDQARARPGSIDYGSTGIGSTVHMTIELLASNAGVKMNNVPYRGPGPMQTDLLSGRVTVSSQSLATALPMYKAGKLDILAVTPRRVAQLPDVPAVDEIIPGYDVSIWLGVILPQGAPTPLAHRLRKDFEEAMKAPTVEALLNSSGLEPFVRPADVFWAKVRADVVRWKKLADDAGIKPQQ